jgi:hypothetical protein
MKIQSYSDGKRVSNFARPLTVQGYSPEFLLKNQNYVLVSLAKFSKAAAGQLGDSIDDLSVWIIS